MIDARKWLPAVLFSLIAAYSQAKELSRSPELSGAPIAGIDSAALAKFNYGRGLFHHVYEPAVHADGEMTGLGPLFNAQSCAECHVGDGRGAPPDIGTGLVLALVPPDPNYGSQLQDRAVSGVEPEGAIRVTFAEHEVRLADGPPVTLHLPHYEPADLVHGPLAKTTNIAARLAPPLFGAGLLEAVPEAALREMADPKDGDGDGISGRPSLIAAEDGTFRVGRFGWKAGAETILAQTIKAAREDMGLEEDAGDIETQSLFLLGFYVAHLAPPPRGGADETTRAGEKVFTRIGCSACHRERLPIAGKVFPALLGEVISPYTDLLLHDLGAELVDPVATESTLAGEWRTAPLWGLGLASANPQSRYLHDGRARSLTEAILWHGGEAERSREDFRNLPAGERAALLAFLESL